MRKNFALLSALLFSASARAASPVAYVYVQEVVAGTTSPIYAFSAASDGRLTKVKGSPFNDTTGTIIGTNGSHFFTLLDGDPYQDEYSAQVFSNEVASDGAIGGSVGSLATECADGNTAIPQAKLDHSGKNVWLACGEELLKFSSTLSGEESSTTEPSVTYSLPTFSGTAEIPIGAYSPYSCASVFYTGNGAPLTVVNPQPVVPGYGQYIPIGPITNDPTDHFAVAMVPVLCNPGGLPSFGRTQLASFMVTKNGDDVTLTSTNSYETMPTLPGGVYPFGGMVLNPAGTILAVETGGGIQFFHFNGAKPITPFEGLPTGLPDFGSAPRSALTWDESNHLYVVDGANGKLYVYTVTEEGAVKAPGSPYSVVPQNSNITLIVRSN
jgi:hypothetical protein